MLFLFKGQEMNRQIKRSYRTANRAGNTAKMPNILATITNPEFSTALTFNKMSTSHNGSSAYLKPVKPLDCSAVDTSVALHIDGDTLFIGENPATEVDFRDLYTDRSIREINTFLLEAIYSVIYQNTNIDNDTVQDVCIDIYIPDFLCFVYGSRNYSEDQKQAVIRELKSFHNIIGIIEETGYSSVHRDRYILLLIHNICESTNTIRVSSPYMNKLIHILSQKRLVINKKTGRTQYAGNKPVEKPNYSYLIKGTLATARSRRSAEIVRVIVVIVAQCGRNGIPNAKIRTIIDRCPSLNAALLSYQNTSDKNKLLQRSFSTAWDYLAQYTLLVKDKKAEIVKYIPSLKDLDRVLYFVFTERRIEITINRPKT